MSVITLPDDVYFEALSWAMMYADVDFESTFGSQSQEVDVPRWAVTASVGRIMQSESGSHQAMLLKLRGKKNQLELWNHARPIPLGTLRGTGVPFTLAANVAQGATSMQLVAGTSNLLTFPEAFDNAAWTPQNATVFQSPAVSAPDGTATAEKLVETTATNSHFIYQSRTGSNETITLSVFAKAVERTKLALRLSNFATESIAAQFDLSNGTLIFISAPNADYTLPSTSIISIGNGWYRCIFTVTKGAVNTTNNAQFELLNAAGAATYTGDGTSGLLLWGAKLEVGSAPTDYGYGKTLLKGDLLGIGSGLTQQVVMMTEDSLSIGQGNITVYFEAPLRNAFTAGAEVRFDKPKALFRRQGESRAGWDYESTLARGFNLQLIEDWRA